MRILTAGESHGEYIVAILEGFPKGVKIEENLINQELKRRMSGAGRGKRMSLEKDKIIIATGLRNKVSLGSPIALLVKNKDVQIFAQSADNLAPLSVPRPAHADLAGALKYGDKDIRNILERASARETVSRVGLGSICKQFLGNFNIKAASFTVSIGTAIADKRPKSISEILAKTKKSPVNSLDNGRAMLEEIEAARKDKDTLGGVVEIWVQGLPAGLGSCMHFDRRLDAKLAAAFMGIPAVKGVEIGLGFEYALLRGRESHDAIYYSRNKGFYHKANNSGGIEGGISNGAPIVARIAMKPIATLGKPLDSVNLRSKRAQKAPLVRSDVCAVVACGVIAESVAAIVITEAMLEKFGCDSLSEIKTNYKNFMGAINRAPTK